MDELTRILVFQRDFVNEIVVPVSQIGKGKITAHDYLNEPDAKEAIFIVRLGEFQLNFIRKFEDFVDGEEFGTITLKFYDNYTKMWVNKKFLTKVGIQTFKDHVERGHRI